MDGLVLLTGISGFVAKQIALKALNVGLSIRGTLRDPRRADEVRQALRPWLKDPDTLDRLSFAPADLEVEAGWDAAMAGAAAVIHTASPFPLAQPKDEGVLIRPALEGTARVLRAARRAGVSRVVLTSSTVAVMNAGRDRIFTEDDWCDPSDPAATPYARSKVLAERKAWDIAQSEGLHLTAINPGFILGPPLDGHYGSSLRLIERLLKGRDPMVPAYGFPVVDVRDVAEMHVRALLRPETVGRRYIAAAGSLSLAEMGRLLKAEYPVRRIPTVEAPGVLMRVMALWDPAVRAILPELGRIQRVSNQRAVQEMGMEFIAPQVALKACADWLVRSGQIWH